ncbi:oxidoreductase family protein [Agaribacterium sp. ZY112]|uniref:oxidoreductase family protein n=1 Tax=Agaribacterium sp. ZY112 TaxID=3233574 RepID=UPI003523BB53
MLSINTDFILRATKARDICAIEKLQSLWSGYGQILRVGLQGGSHKSVIVKHIKLPDSAEHPRGWNTQLSHQRKLKSYQVESYWYQHYAQRCDVFCPTPSCLALEQDENETYLLLSDLAEAGFSELRQTATTQELYACLSWLAHFHARFLQEVPKGLWLTGSYWHLATRPDELKATEDKQLVKAAPLIDKALRDCPYQTLIHGDAKIANFCFMPKDSDNTSSTVAAVDFQYVGGGCGVQDLAYFLGSCLSEEECERQEKELLDYYFLILSNAVKQSNADINSEHLEQEWRALYDVACADFYRFLAGWSPGHWKLNGYSERLCQQVIKRLL